MDIRIYSCVTITILVKAAVSNAFCSLRNEDQCFYTVNCDNPAVINTITSCEHADPYVTLIINKSNVNNVTANYFTTNYDTGVRLVRALENTWTAVQAFAFSNFKNVLYIDLSKNHINYIGAAFKGLEVLDSLNLSWNRLDVIDPGTFMISENNNRVYLLDLSYNLLTYLPEDLFIHLYNLRKLYLQGNIMLILSNEYSKYLKNFNYLNLCCCNLSMLNITTKYLTSMRELDLSYNEIKTLNISGLISLETINLSHNEIEGFMMDDFQKMPYLISVDFSHNKLRNISCTNYRPQTYKTVADYSKQFTRLNLNNNNISHINSHFFLIFDRISYLNLSYNEIEEFSPGTFKYVNILKYLTVSNCRLKLNEETFKGLKSTIVIDISSNNITTLDATFFSECKLLQNIVANNNPIKYVDIAKLIVLLPNHTRITFNLNNDFKIMNERLALVMLFGILLAFLYVSVHRRVVFVYTLKCVRCVLVRFLFKIKFTLELCIIFVAKDN